MCRDRPSIHPVFVDGFSEKYTLKFADRLAEVNETRDYLVRRRAERFHILFLKNQIFCLLTNLKKNDYFTGETRGINHSIRSGGGCRRRVLAFVCPRQKTCVTSSV